MQLSIYEKNLSDDSGRKTMHSPSRVDNENMGDTVDKSFNFIQEIQFNSLNDPPQPTSVFDDGYCIHETTTPSRINDFTPNSRTFSAMAQDGHNLPSGNQHPYPFGYMPVLVPGIVHYFPCWLPSRGGWIAADCFLDQPDISTFLDMAFVPLNMVFITLTVT